MDTSQLQNAHSVADLEDSGDIFAHVMKKCKFEVGPLNQLIIHQYQQFIENFELKNDEESRNVFFSSVILSAFSSAS